MGAIDRLRRLRWQAAGHYSRPLGDAFTAPLQGTKALEIGGPTASFAADGLLPVDPLATSVDNVQWSDDTVWHGAQGKGQYAPDGKVRGKVVIADDLDLPTVSDGSYDAVIHAHVIEHLANPLRAVAAWKRVLSDAGALLLVAPHKQGTFDHRRAVTPLDHIVADYENGTDEADLTHLDETLTLHDRSRDAETGTQEEWAARRRDNFNTRLLHHHVFTAPALIDVLRAGGFGIHALEIRHPHDIYVLARPGSDRMSAGEIKRALSKSPFSSDRAG
jgi:SAM-dependent methyltransferase